MFCLFCSLKLHLSGGCSVSLLSQHQYWIIGYLVCSAASNHTLGSAMSRLVLCLKRKRISRCLVSSSAQKQVVRGRCSVSLLLPTWKSGLFNTLYLLQLEISVEAYDVLAGFFSKSKSLFAHVLAHLLFKSTLHLFGVRWCLLCQKCTRYGLMSCFFSLKSQNEDSDVLARLLSKTNLPADHDSYFCLSVNINIWSLYTLLPLQIKDFKRTEDVLSPLFSKCSTIHVLAHLLSKYMIYRLVSLSFCSRS